MDYDLNNLYIGGLSRGNHYLWGSSGSGKTNIATMYFSKLRGQWQVQEPKKDFESPFKNA